MNSTGIIRICLTAIIIVAAAIILSLNSVNIRIDTVLNTSSNLNPIPYTYPTYSYAIQPFTHLSKSLFFNSMMVAGGVYIPSFSTSMNFYNANLSVWNSEIFSVRDQVLNQLGAKEPRIGDSIFLSLNINASNTFSSYVDYVLTDENDYVLGTSGLTTTITSYGTICGLKQINLGPDQDKTLNIRVDTSKFMNNGNYKVYVIFYNIQNFQNSQTPSNCGQLDNQKSFYEIIPFTIYSAPSSSGTFFITMTLLLFAYAWIYTYIPVLANSLNQIRRNIPHNWLRMIWAVISKPSVIVFILFLILIIILFNSI